MDTKKEKKGFFGWFANHPTKALLILLLVIVPVLLLSLIYANYTKKGKSFYFEKKDDTPVLLYQSDLSSKKKIADYFTFTVNIDTFKYVEEDKTKGDYTFKKVFSPKENYKEDDFTFKYVLASNWTHDQSTVSTTRSNDFTLTYDYDLPKRHSIFKVGKPILYIEITLKKDTPAIGNLPAVSENEVFYLKYDLNKVEYPNVRQK
ncbi:hypothetical protein [Haploplasma axanthum]|uniref:Uncharacterized protein n=1 Tax=Haploplasma axanthum TaxID=29552 RepID=A0A449BE04_HAPAX|nr:hypothetical protein [Haploplasma axanthum]VEU80681.1 Uncharacterised protein [Haploplasma axanthum]